jgi:tubulin-specific chaperone A
MAGQETQNQKQCRIKTAGIKRYIKEYQSYVKEVTQDQERVNKMIEENDGLHSINKMKEVLEETKAMVPHVKEKLINAVEDLEMFLEENEEEEDLADSELLANAKVQIEEAHAFLEQIENQDGGEMDVETNPEDEGEDAAEEDDDDEELVPIGSDDDN